MQFDFTSVIDRRGLDSIAANVIPFSDVTVKEGFDPIPMWIADMSFATAPSVLEAMQKRLAHPTFGYFSASDEYKNAIVNWQKTRNGVSEISWNDIGFDNSVLGGLMSAVNATASRGSSILIHSPTYIGFTGSLIGAGYKLVHSPLVPDENGVMRMDFEDMEKKLAENDIHTAVFCSPHNPTGRVWEKWELEKAAELFKKYDVYVICDEIWSDLILEGHRHIPFQNVSEDARNRTVGLYAITKTFNLAGLVGSYHIIYNKALRDRVNREASLSHYNGMNVFSMHALVGAYSEAGESWLEELRSVLTQNVKYAREFILNNFDGVEPSDPEGTYILFLDCTKWCEKHGKSIDDVQRAGVEVGVIWQDGRPFGGACHTRMNLALPMSQLKEALDRLKTYVFIY